MLITMAIQKVVRRMGVPNLCQQPAANKLKFQQIKTKWYKQTQNCRQAVNHCVSSASLIFVSSNPSLSAIYLVIMILLLFVIALSVFASFALSRGARRAPLMYLHKLHRAHTVRPYRFQVEMLGYLIHGWGNRFALSHSK